MTAISLALRATGLVTSVGLDAPSSCAAIRAKLTNPSETRFRDALGAWIMAHPVPLERPWRGLERLARMAAMAIEEALACVPRDVWSRTPVLLCVAEPERPGREDGLDDRLFGLIEQMLDASFSADSGIVAYGRVGAAVALTSADRLLRENRCDQVLIAAVDSLIRWPTLSVFEAGDRLLTSQNSDGFMPGEGAGALLMAASCDRAALQCNSVGFAMEPAPLDSGRPLRGEGLSSAIHQALAASGHQMHDMDARIADLSGEQYYFKEAALAMARTLQQRKEFFDLWHPAECTGDIGAVSGVSMLAVVDAAFRKGYAPGRRLIAHLGNDKGARAAIVVQQQEPA